MECIVLTHGIHLRRLRGLIHLSKKQPILYALLAMRKVLEDFFTHELPT